VDKECIHYSFFNTINSLYGDPPITAGSIFTSSQSRIQKRQPLPELVRQQNGSFGNIKTVLSRSS